MGIVTAPYTVLATPSEPEPTLIEKFKLVISDLDILRSANVLVKQHGEDASLEAAQRADALLEAGDMDGHAVWLRIVKAVKELLNKERPAGASLQ